MLILENREKLMEDGLETKAPSFLAFILSIEKQEKAEKAEKEEKAEKSRICCKVLYTNSRSTQNQK